MTTNHYAKSNSIHPANVSSSPASSPSHVYVVKACCCPHNTMLQTSNIQLLQLKSTANPPYPPYMVEKTLNDSAWERCSDMDSPPLSDSGSVTPIMQSPGSQTRLDGPEKETTSLLMKEIDEMRTTGKGPATSLLFDKRGSVAALPSHKRSSMAVPNFRKASLAPQSISSVQTSGQNNVGPASTSRDSYYSGNSNGTGKQNLAHTAREDSAHARTCSRDHSQSHQSVARAILEAVRDRKKRKSLSGTPKNDVFEPIQQSPELHYQRKEKGFGSKLTNGHTNLEEIQTLDEEIIEQSNALFESPVRPSKLQFSPSGTPAKTSSPLFTRSRLKDRFQLRNSVKDKKKHSTGFQTGGGFVTVAGPSAQTLPVGRNQGKFWKTNLPEENTSNRGGDIELTKNKIQNKTEHQLIAYNSSLLQGEENESVADDNVLVVNGIVEVHKDIKNGDNSPNLAHKTDHYTMVHKTNDEHNRSTPDHVRMLQDTADHKRGRSIPDQERILPKPTYHARSPPDPARSTPDHVRMLQNDIEDRCTLDHARIISPDHARVLKQTPDHNRDRDSDHSNHSLPSTSYEYARTQSSERVKLATRMVKDMTTQDGSRDLETPPLVTASDSNTTTPVVETSPKKAVLSIGLDTSEKCCLPVCCSVCSPGTESFLEFRHKFCTSYRLKVELLRNPVDACILPNEYIAVADYDNGLLVLNPKGDIVQHCTGQDCISACGVAAACPSGGEFRLFVLVYKEGRWCVNIMDMNWETIASLECPTDNAIEPWALRKIVVSHSSHSKDQVTTPLSPEPALYLLASGETKSCIWLYDFGFRAWQLMVSENSRKGAYNDLSVRWDPVCRETHFLLCDWKKAQLSSVVVSEQIELVDTHTIRMRRVKGQEWIVQGPKLAQWDEHADLLVYDGSGKLFLFEGETFKCKKVIGDVGKGEVSALTAKDGWCYALCRYKLCVDAFLYRPCNETTL